MTPDPENTAAVDTAAVDIAAVFGRAAPTYDTVFPFFARFGARIVEEAGLRTGDKVLDVGCGRGATLLPAAARVGPNGSVLGIDLAEEMVSMLAADLDRLGVENAAVRRMDAEALDVEEKSFDVVVSSFVVHLLGHPERAVAGYLRALRPGGRCVASVPIGDGPEWDFLKRLYGEFLPRAARPPAIPFRPDFDLSATMASAGFEVESNDELAVGLLFDDAQGWWDWAWSNGIRDLFETLTPDDLEEMRQKSFAELGERMTAEGLELSQRANVVVAYRPGE